MEVWGLTLEFGLSRLSRHRGSRLGQRGQSLACKDIFRFFITSTATFPHLVIVVPNATFDRTHHKCLHDLRPRVMPG